MESVRIFVIGVGDLVDMTEISTIASDPSYYYEFLLRSFDDLVMYARRIFDVICSPLEPSPSLDFSRCRVDFAFVLDGSKSVGQGDWQRTIAFLKDLAQRLEIGPDATQIGVVTVGDRASLDVKLNQHKTTAAFVSAMDTLTFRDEGRNTAAGLKVAHEELFTPASGARPDADHIAVVITAGEATVDADKTLQEAEAARADGIRVFAIGVGPSTNQDELRRIADKPSADYVRQMPDFESLVKNFEKVLSAACYSAAVEVWQCGFDAPDASGRLCGLQQEVGDQFDWTVKSGPTQSAYTGPPGAQAGLYYAYIEASSPRVEGDEARLILPLSANISGTYCFRFYASMFGYHVGALQVFVRRHGVDVTRWTSYGPRGQDWLDTDMDLRLQPGDQESRALSNVESEYRLFYFTGV